jgi:hypothetical protein
MTEKKQGPVHQCPHWGSGVPVSITLGATPFGLSPAVGANTSVSHHYGSVN